MIGCNGKSENITVKNQEEIKKIILINSDKMQKEFLDGNLDAFFKYIDPDELKKGSVEEAKKIMESGLQDVIKTIEKTSFGNDFEVIEDGGRLCAIIPMFTLYKFPDGKMMVNSYRVAFSNDKGKSWFFIDGIGKKDQEDYLREKFPILTKKIPFPACKNIRVE
jgi:NADPH:quinone reductase-like Zn-dependent oxidoreductase